MDPYKYIGALNVDFQLAVTIGILAAHVLNYSKIHWGWTLGLGDVMATGGVNVIATMVPIYSVDILGMRLLFLEGGVQMLFCQDGRNIDRCRCQLLPLFWYSSVGFSKRRLYDLYPLWCNELPHFTAPILTNKCFNGEARQLGFHVLSNNRLSGDFGQRRSRRN
ncbi:hypothetical protein RDI58_024212 [Solanum bulbocastanum]|uniref:Uncharacterized protein n=1 Tax=Solanum bulbocastanum TaxID=147425 RepID=A0AAN8SZK5_SOLBU